tara:strand:+ start:87 stop:1205 length:1119 start_codon:yes stop_codon:yes gene_type:complete
LKIAVIGANGQVGREVSLFLHVMGVDVVPVSRTEIGGVFLERCGLTCRYGSVSDENDANRVLEGCDLVVDFAHPTGLPSKIRKAVKSNIDNIVRCAPQRTPYVYISTISAYGMRDEDSKMKNYFLPRTLYAGDKRHLERHALSYKKKRDIYVLRLSQVHGILQTVSHQFMEETASGNLTLPFSANTDSYTVFCYSIAEAMINIAQGKERPGLYTFVSTPTWSWGEVYTYWARQCGGKLEISFQGNVDSERSRLRPFRNLAHFLLTPLVRLGMKHRQLILNYLLVGNYWFQERMQAEHLRRKASSEMGQGISSGGGRKFQIGKIPGKRLASLTDSRITMEEATLAVRVIIDSAVPSFDKITVTKTNPDASNEL